MIKRFKIRLRRRLGKRKERKRLSTDRTRLLTPASANSKSVSTKKTFGQIFCPTRSRVKLHQTGSAAVPLTAQVSRLNQRASDVRTGLEHSISSLQTQRLQHLTSLNEKTRDLERAAAAFEYSSSKHLKQELNRTKQMSLLFRIAIAVCFTLVSFSLSFVIIQFIHERRTWPVLLSDVSLEIPLVKERRHQSYFLKYVYWRINRIRHTRLYTRTHIHTDDSNRENVH